LNGGNRRSNGGGSEAEDQLHFNGSD
jgi:hypothetical protein